MRKVIVQTEDSLLFGRLAQALHETFEKLDVRHSQSSVQTEVEQMDQGGALQGILPGLPSLDYVVVGDEQIEELIQIATEHHADDAVRAIFDMHPATCSL